MALSLDEEIGDRLFRIRAACGRGERDPETLEAFAQRVERLTGASYNPVTVSNLERGKRRWLVEDVRNFAAVDPQHRGEVWLSGMRGPMALTYEQIKAQFLPPRNAEIEAPDVPAPRSGQKVAEKPAGGKKKRA